MSKLQHQIERRRGESPDFAQAFDRASREIHAANEFMAAISDMLEERGLSKADLARLVDKNPSAVRKLFLAGANPTLSTAFEIAHALGARVTVSAPELIDA